MKWQQMPSEIIKTCGLIGIPATGVIVDNTKIDFMIRWCRNAASITPENYRVVFSGELYNIIGIDHMNFKKKSIKLKCQKVRR